LASQQEVFRNETVASGNHAAPDLPDPRVVENMINDPEYDRTSMQSDASKKLRTSLQ
jgi:hypothetical protein